MDFGYNQIINSNLNFTLINVYGPIKNDQKKALWTDLNNHLNSNQEENHFLGGNFNEILNNLLQCLVSSKALIK